MTTQSEEVSDDDAWMLHMGIVCNWLAYKKLPGNRYAALHPKVYTYSIIVGKIGDECSYDDYWCYTDYAVALLALNAWDGAGDPDGWHRHPKTGRRRALVDGEFDEEGNQVAAGTLYVRF